MTIRYSYAQGVLHTGALAAFAVAQPLYDLLTSNPAFLTAHYAQPLDIAALVVLLSALVPMALIATAAFSRLLGPNAWKLMHSVTLTALIGAFFLPLLQKTLSLPGAALVGVSLLCGAALCALLWRNATARKLLSVLCIAAFLFPALFVLHASIHPFAFPERNPLDLPQVEATAPVVVLILDELPVASLMNEQREIDRIRYPNFARLADSAWWFRDATTVSDDTVSGAVPAIVTGTYPDNPAKYRQSSQSLFTLLGGSYEMNVFETYTRICPTQLCPKQELLADRLRLLFSDIWVVYAHILLPEDMRERLPDISQGWKNFHQQALNKNEQRAERLDKLWNSRTGWVDTFINSIESSDQPQLYFLHVLLPHLPWSYLPNGTSYSLAAKGLYGVPGVKKEFWGDNEWTVQQGYQRHLLQLGYVDLIIGRLLDKLKAQGMYDETLLVVTADHGVSFRPGDGRRPLTGSNAADIMRIPLFIKAPGQTTGSISSRNVETVDILPTMAQILETNIPWAIDGTSAINADAKERSTRTMYQQNRKATALRNRIPEDAFSREPGSLNTKLGLFGSGGDTDRLYAFGPNRDLVGTPAAQHQQKPTPAGSVAVTFDEFTTGADAPWAISGLLQGITTGSVPRNLALAIDGTICGVTRSHVNDATESAFVVFVGPVCTITDASELNLYVVSANSSDIVLSRIERALTQ